MFTLRQKIRAHTQGEKRGQLSSCLADLSTFGLSRTHPVLRKKAYGSQAATRKKDREVLECRPRKNLTLSIEVKRGGTHDEHTDLENCPKSGNSPRV